MRLYVEVTDLEGAIARAVALGTHVERGRTFLGSEDFWFANVRDPQGNLVRALDEQLCLVRLSRALPGSA